jgi:hypothetical protein
MPPYMRDSDALPLSITRRQYQVLMELLREAKKKKLKLKSPVERLSEQLEQRKSGSPGESTAGRKKDDGNET